MSLLAAAISSTAAAHEVPKDTHDRSIVVHLLPGAQPGLATVRVDYRLEVDELTAFTRDLAPYLDEIDPAQYRGKLLTLWGELARRLGPDLAFRLNARANGKRLDFTCTSHKARLSDDEGKALGHLRCDFVFECSFPLLAAKENDLDFRDQSYQGEEGKVDVGLGSSGLAIRSKTVADDTVKKRTPLEREPGDDDKLREVRVVFAETEAEPVAQPLAVSEPAAPPRATSEHDDHLLFRLIWDADYGFWLTMLMALVFGAAHALTPGHGKTLVAAYLVGERGTMTHALVLGVVTTLTHTGVVLLIAFILFCLPSEARDSFGRAIHDGLGLIMGLLVVCMGVWLLLQRLAGRADHVHIGGGHHHGAPETGDRSQESGVKGQVPGTLRWGGLILLGITGGLVPCWDAIYLLLYTVGRSQFAIALPAVLAFSAGLAGVLVLIGILVVQVPNFARSRLGYGKIVRALPIVSAVVVTLMGLWLCYEGVHGR